MKNLSLLVSVSIFASIVSGCVSLPKAPSASEISKCQDIHIGMSMNEVTAILGPPIQKQAEMKMHDGSTAVMYQFAGFSTIHFADGKVSIVTCYGGGL